MVLLKSQYLLKGSQIAVRSTFHYGSIKIVKAEEDRIKSITSTFHYGSIKIYLILSQFQQLHNLHSTMVLLKFLIK